MATAELFSEIREKMKPGEDGKIDATRIKSMLKEIENDYNDVVENVKIASAESKKRKEKIRDELMPKLTQYEERIAELEKTSDKSELEAELTKLKEYKKNTLKNQRDVFSKEFEKIMKHPNFEKAKDRFVLPEKGEDDVLDFTKLKDEDLEKNMTSLNDLNSLDYFAGKDTKPIIHGDKFKTVDPQEKLKIHGTEDLKGYLKQQLTNEIIE